MNCGRCGRPLEQGATYCGNCGQQIHLPPNMASNPDGPSYPQQAPSGHMSSQLHMAAYSVQAPQTPHSPQYGTPRPYAGYDTIQASAAYQSADPRFNTYQMAQPPQQSQTKSITSLILGIVGLLMSGLLIGGVMGGIAIVMGVLGIGEKQDKIRCIIGIIFGILAVAVTGLMVWALFFSNRS